MLRRPRARRRSSRSVVSPASVSGLVLLAALAALTGAAGEEATVRVAATVDGNFRGVYDILVRPSGATVPAERTRGLVEANFLGIPAGEGISIDQWRAVQALPGVEIAAPIAAVGYLGLTGTAPIVEIPVPAEPTLYQIEVGVAASDGVREVGVARESGLLFIRPRPGGLQPVVHTTFLGSGYHRDLDVVTLLVRRFPVFPGLMVAVDPVSEGALLGRPAFDAMGGLPPTDLQDTQSFPAERIPEDFPLIRSLIRARARFVSEGAPGVPSSSPAQVVPVLLATSGAPSVRVRWTIWDVPVAPRDPEDPGSGGEAQVLIRVHDPDAPRRLVVDETLDFSQFGLPLAPPALYLSAEGGARVPEGYVSLAGELSPHVARRPSYAAASPLADASDLPAFEVRALGFSPAVPPDDARFPSWEGSGLPVAFEEPQSEPSYRRLDQHRSTGLPPDPETSWRTRPYFLAPLGTIDLEASRPPYDPVNYAPLGAYDPADTGLVADPDGTWLADPLQLRPTFNPRGLIVTPAAAFTTIAGAAYLKGDRPIDAIRVRVSGITGFDDLSRRRLAEVALAIRALGLRADVVAGSSPRDVLVFVPDYLGTPEDPEDLGWVEQHWTSLGAAAEVTTGLTDLTRRVLALALGVAVLFSFAAQTLAVQSRTREIALVRAVGWRRRHVLRAVATASLRSGLAVGGLGLAAALAWGRVPPGHAVLWWPPALVAAAWIAATPLAVRRANRVEPLRGASAGDVGRSRLPRSVRTLRSYGLRQALARPARAVIQVVALGLGTGAFALAGVLAARAGHRAGPTALAALTSQAIRPLHVGIVICTGGLLLSVAAALRRADLGSRRDERAALLAMGWTRPRVRSARRVEDLVLGLLAAVVGAAAVVALGPGASPGGGLLALGAAVAPILAVGATLAMGGVVTRGEGR